MSLNRHVRVATACIRQSAGEYVILDASQPLHAQYCVSVAHADMKQCFLADIACPANLSSLKVDVKQFKSELASAARCCGETHGTFMSRCSLDLFYITIRHLLHAQQPDVRIPVFIAFVPSTMTRLAACSKTIRFTCDT